MAESQRSSLPYGFYILRVFDHLSSEILVFESQIFGF